MINTYQYSQNPCGFCEDPEVEAFMEKKDKYLEVSLCGNDTKLYVRETSEDCGPARQVQAPGAGPQGVSNPSDLTVVSNRRTERSERTATRCEPPNTELLTALYTKKWSGKTYFEEELRKIRDQVYRQNVGEARRRRKLWRTFERAMRKEKRRDLVRSSGPEWWQEPSSKQICLVTGLEEVVKADHEEGVTGRTRQWLLDLGVTKRLTPKQVKACMRNSLLDPVDFLLEAHAEVRKSQLNVKKKKGDLERPFSINERILLSAMCVLQLPTLLTILHYILPPPRPTPEAAFVQELLYGDLEDEAIRYATPYMEPLPFRNKNCFNDWAFEGVFHSFLPTILREEGQQGAWSRRATRATLTSARMSMVSQGKVFTDRMAATKRFSESSTRSPTVFWLISHCASKRVASESMTPMSVADSELPRFFCRHLTKRSLFPRRNVTDEFSPAPHGGGKINFWVPPGARKKQSYGLGSAGTENKPSTVNSRRVIEVESSSGFRSESLASVQSPKKAAELSLKTAVTEEAIDVVEGGPVTEELKRIWDEIKDSPENKQIGHAFKILAEIGDPLAQLPKLESLPTIRRWLELRRGRNRVLSGSTREELLRKSRGMWKVAPAGCTAKGPKIPCSKRVERKLTWDRKDWLSEAVRREMHSYFTRVRQEKVDNSRSFFPTMLNHYDHGSRLTRAFRDVFFAYLPAREADTLVYKPWQPMETTGAR